MATLIQGTAAAGFLVGSEENDIIYTNGGADTVYGFGGNDTLVQRLGSAEVMFGGHGNDVYVVLDGAISVSERFGSGVDTLRTYVSMTADLPDGIENIENIAYNSALTLRGNSGDNTITCGSASDTAYGRGGNDRIVGGDVNVCQLSGEDGNDHLTGSNRISPGRDTLDGGAGNDILDGRLGPDDLFGLAGNDTYILGSDTTDSIAEASGIDTIVSTISRNLSTFLGLENLVLAGTAVINGTGDGFANAITGNVAANTLSGAGGNDVLTGGGGVDTLAGGANSDFFVFNAPLSAANRDVVNDFNPVQDTFRLENAVMTALGAAGVLNPNLFFAGAAAHDTNDRIVYNKVTGALFYDANGNAAGGVTHLATLVNKPTLAAGDFAVI